MKATRRIVQLCFLALVVVGVFVLEGNAERWCPFGGIEAIYTYAREGNMPCSLAMTNFYAVAGLLLLTLLVRRAFCSYLCPIGSLSEWLYAGGRRLRLPLLPIPPALDRLLSLLQYAVLALILSFTYRTGELLFRGFDPCYALIGRHGEDITFWAYAIAGAIAAGSLLTSIPFCRWLCPLAAVLNPFSRFAWARVRRDESSCIGCGECSRACPMAIPVAEVRAVTHARCTSCMNCVESCPERQNGPISWGFRPKAGRSHRWSQATLIAALLFCLGAVLSLHYSLPLPSFVKTRGDRSPRVEKIELQIANLTCRGRANLLMYYLERDDISEIDGYLEVEAWPGPGLSKVVITYEPDLTGATAVKEAITEPYFDQSAKVWRSSPFVIVGYDP